MTTTTANDYIEHHADDPETTGMQRMKRKTQARRGKYVKSQRPVRRGIKGRCTRRIMW